MFLKNGLLNLDGQVFPYLFWPIDAIEQENAAMFRIFEDIEAFKEGGLVAGDEIGLIGADQVRSVDRARPEAQVRDGN
jgi:hypothetical protein